MQDKEIELSRQKFLQQIEELVENQRTQKTTLLSELTKLQELEAKRQSGKESLLFTVPRKRKAKQAGISQKHNSWRNSGIESSILREK